jgi:hypothetical protein
MLLVGDKPVNLGGDGVKACGFPEQIHESHGLTICPLNLKESEDDDGPRNHVRNY